MNPLDQQLIKACQKGDIHTVQTLLQQGADPNAQDQERKQTPFMLAAQNGNIPILQLLLQHGANPHTTDTIGRNALYYAVEYRKYNTVKYLLTKPHLNPNTQTQYGITPFMIAAQNDDIKMLQLLIQHGANPHITNQFGQNALHYAVEYRKYDTVEYLITQLHLNPNTQTQYGTTPFMIAAKNGDIKMLELLLQLGANPHTTDHQGQTAIHHAVGYRRYETAKYLLTKIYLDPNTQEKNGITPFMIAAKNGDIKMLKLLIQYGANPAITDEYGKNGIHYAVEYNECDTVEYLITQIHLNPNIQDAIGQTPFMIAAKNDNIRMLQLLLQHGANPYATDQEGQNALQYAKDPTTIHFLISLLHLNPNTQDHQGNTPLLTALKYYNIDTAQTLTQLGTHPNIPNRRGQKTTTTAKRKRITLGTPQPSTITL